MTTFPEVQSGGSLILAWQVKDKDVLVVGGGEVAAGRILNLLNADALITVVCPSDGLNPEVQHRLSSLPSRISHISRSFEPVDLDLKPWTMVLTAINDPLASSEIYKLCHKKRIPANIADVPPECDFYFGSVHRDGPLQIMVSTNGNGPRMAAMVRRQIARGLPPNLGNAIRKIGELRKKLRKVAPEPEEGPKRMKWMSKVCEQWKLEDFTDMTEEDMDLLLRSYSKGTVPKFETLRVGQDPDVVWEWDGSFGWG